jgi:hypothetical protein
MVNAIVRACVCIRRPLTRRAADAAADGRTLYGQARRDTAIASTVLGL